MRLSLLPRFFSIGVLLASTGPNIAAVDKVPLKLDLPQPLYVGTPRPIQLANLEPSSNESRKDFLVPAGTILLSKNKPVTSSDPQPVIGELSFITDGDKTSIEGSYVELGPNLQWVQIDLGAACRIAAIVVWHFHAQSRVYHDVVLQVSDDPEFKRNVVTLFNNDHDNSAKLGRGAQRAYLETHFGKLVDAGGSTARYVRLFSNGNTSDEMNHYCEVEVYGVPAK